MISGIKLREHSVCMRSNWILFVLDKILIPEDEDEDEDEDDWSTINDSPR